MQKFKDFILLNEASKRSKVISRDQFKQLLMKNCFKTAKYCLENKKYLYRGLESHTKILLVDPSKTRRISIDVKNYYNLIMSNDKQWKKYPPREYSVILTNSTFISGKFGTHYIAFPYDGANFGIVQSEDIWDIWSRKLSKFLNTTEFLETIYEIFLGDSETKNYSYNYNLFIKKCNEFDDGVLEFKKAMDKVFTKKYSLNYIMYNLISTREPIIRYFISNPNKKLARDDLNDSLESGHDTANLWAVNTLIKFGYHPIRQGLYETLAKMFSPEEGFSVTNNIRNVLAPSRTKAKEIWTDSKCLLIDAEFMFDDINISKFIEDTFKVKLDLKKILQW